MIFEGFYLDGRVPLGGGFDVSFRRAVWIFIISKARQLAEISPCTRAFWHMGLLSYFQNSIIRNSILEGLMKGIYDEE